MRDSLDITLEIEKPMAAPFAVGPWRVDPELNRLEQLHSPHQQRSLEPRLMHLLCFMASNAGRVLTRQQLISELWPTVIVTENSLTRAISELRKQLTLPNNPGCTLIKTVPKRGYRLTCAPGPLVAKTNWWSRFRGGKESAQAAVNGPLSRRRLLQVAACLVLGVQAISYSPTSELNSGSASIDKTTVYDQVINHNALPSGAQLRNSAHIEQQPTTQPERDAAFSPDGTVLAFLDYANGLSTVYLDSVYSTNEPVAIFTSESFLYNLSWSPLGNALLFARQSNALLPTLVADPGRHADLVMLDLTTLEISVLIDNSPPPGRPAAV